MLRVVYKVKDDLECHNALPVYQSDISSSLSRMSNHMSHLTLVTELLRDKMNCTATVQYVL